MSLLQLDVRRSARGAQIGLCAALIALLWCLTTAQMTLGWWGTVALLVGLSGWFVIDVRRARTPLIQADVRGLKVRADDGWSAITWSDIELIEVVIPRFFWSTGKLVVHPTGRSAVALTVGDPGLAAGIKALAPGVELHQVPASLWAGLDPRPAVARLITVSQEATLRAPRLAFPVSWGSLALATESAPPAPVVMATPTPVIGPLLMAARLRARVEIVDLAAHTRIAPEVIEAVERDDFTMIESDFAARGHLRTLARVVGIDAGPLIDAYDATYATREGLRGRVFGAELSDGALSGAQRRSGWTLVVAAVMVSGLVWALLHTLAA